MPIDAKVIGIRWDVALAGSVEQSQQWVLYAMGRYGESLVTMLWRILGNEQDVCDAYQQTFLNLAHNRDTKKPSNVKAYLFRTASNIAISTLRKKRIIKNSTSVIAAACDVNSNDYAVDLDAKELQSTLRAAIVRLPNYLKEVVVLRDLGELEYSDIAKILGISASSARVYRCKAVALLASWMSNHDEDR